MNNFIYQIIHSLFPYEQPQVFSGFHKAQVHTCVCVRAYVSNHQTRPSQQWSHCPLSCPNRMKLSAKKNKKTSSHNTTSAVNRCLWESAQYLQRDHFTIHLHFEEIFVLSAVHRLEFTPFKKSSGHFRDKDSFIKFFLYLQKLRKRQTMCALIFYDLCSLSVKLNTTLIDWY